MTTGRTIVSPAWRERMRGLSARMRAGSQRGLSPAGERVMRAVLPVVLGPLLPAEVAARDASVGAAITALDDYLGYMSTPVRRQARTLLAVLHLRLVRVVLLGTSAPWSEIPPARIEAFLRSAHGSRVFLLRRIFDFLQSMSVLAWFDLREAWTEIGYPGPPVERPMRTGEPW